MYPPAKPVSSCLKYEDNLRLVLLSHAAQGGTNGDGAEPAWFFLQCQESASKEIKNVRLQKHTSSPHHVKKGREGRHKSHRHIPDTEAGRVSAQVAGRLDLLMSPQER